MKDSVTAIENAAAMTGQILDGVRDDDWARSTPCTDWTVHDVVNHVVGGMRIYAAELTGTTAAGEHDDDWLGDDPIGQYRAAVTEVLHAWRSPGVDQRLVNLSFGTVPAPMAAIVELTEILVHGADVAVATRHEHLIDQAQCAALLQTMTAMGIDAFRAPGIFGPPRPVDPQAPVHRQLLAFLGRETTATAAA